MDDHMIDDIERKIDQCFMVLGFEVERGEKDIKNNRHYKSAAALIRAYNALVKLYYLPEYVKQYSKSSVAQEYKRYLENN